MIHETPRPDSSPSPFATRLAALRDSLSELGLDGYLVPMTDRYQNEYVAPHDRRIRWLTGFTGTAGFVVILEGKASFFTDSRYTLQAQDQIEADLYELFDTADRMPSEWLASQIQSGMKIGFDPALHTIRQVERLETMALKLGGSLVPVEKNLIDAHWSDRPAPEIKPFFAHEALYTGEASASKRSKIGEALKKQKTHAVFITDPASIAWLLNVRGHDVPYTPLPCSLALLRDNGHVEWFMDEGKGSAALDRTVGIDVTRYGWSDLPAAVKRLSETKARVQLDPMEASFSLLNLLRQAGIDLCYSEDPCALPRACKNATEIEGMRAAHRRDGVAMVSFLCWLDKNFSCGTLCELGVEEKLNELRALGSLHQGPSFSTIAASGPHGAIVHYRATKDSNRVLDQNSFLLLDSGAQYLDGTTDITRTIPLGQPSQEMRELFTLVLKGHIALAQARFPEGTSGAELDTLARQFLWQRGLDYGHGTGHGVGSYLCVHEGPQNISRRGTTPLRVGMVTSNEPGFYKARHFGIRIENLQHVIELPEISSDERKMLGFEPLTLAPFDRRAMELSLLSKDEIAWIDSYHARVCRTLRPCLDSETLEWLLKATAPLQGNTP